MTKTIYFLALSLVSTTALAQTEVYTEDFQNGLPVNYTIVDNDGFTPDASVIDFADAWIELVDPDNASDTIVGSTSFFDPVGQADRWLITPAITLSGSGNFLYWDAKSHDPSFLDSYFILASKTDDAIASFTDTVEIINDESSDWTYRQADLSAAGLDNETVHIAFVNRTFDGFKLYLDSISVFVDDPVGLNPISTIDANIYPNPTNGMINIDGSFDMVRIYSTTGTLMFKGTASQIDLSSFNSGIYLVVLNEGDRVSRTKIIKQ